MNRRIAHGPSRPTLPARTIRTIRRNRWGTGIVRILRILRTGRGELRAGLQTGRAAEVKPARSVSLPRHSDPSGVSARLAHNTARERREHSKRAIAVVNTWVNFPNDFGKNVGDRHGRKR